MERRGVSPDSSTHISQKSKKTKKRKHKQKSKTSHKKHKSSNENSRSHKKSKKHKKTKSSHSESDEEIFDIKPLSGYVDNRKQLHQEVFTLVSKKEIKELLPDSLKKLKFKEFKTLCLEQLEVMSQKRLRHIIAGQEMVSSSSDESTEGQETRPQDVQTGTNTEGQQNTNDGENPNASESVTQDGNTSKSAEETQPAKIRLSILEEMSVSPNQEEIDELIEGEVPKVPQQPLDDSEQDEDKDQATMNITTSEPPTTLPVAELKELEFRARALKSLVMARERQQLEEQKQKELNKT